VGVSVDTLDRRRAAIGLSTLDSFPIPDGTLDDLDRATLWHSYAFDSTPLGDVLVLLGAPRAAWGTGRLTTGWTPGVPHTGFQISGRPATGWSTKPPRETP
jgi:hypothetical protein